jgi:VIT1/CCC1 family predicted Fe2+/Mn2+ transporter
MFTRDATGALFFSIGVTLATLFVFGFIKGRFTGTRPMRSAQTALIGSAAAGAAFLLARSIS